MAEYIEVYSLNNKPLGVEEKNKFHRRTEQEFFEKGKVSKKIKQIRLLLINSKGRVYLQKRSKQKIDNPGLYDKTIGGHVRKGETFGMTLVRECAEELGFPASILSEKEFSKAIKSADLGVVGIMKKLEIIKNFNSVRKIAAGKEIILPTISAMYLGYFDGAIRFVDGESCGLETYSLKELKEDIRKNPQKYTEDLEFMIKKYEKLIKPIKKKRRALSD